MSSLTIVTRAGRKVTIECIPGTTMLDNIRNAGIDEIASLCGGGGACATCHVKVDREFLHLLPAMGDMEDALLDGTDYREENSRLACQFKYCTTLDGVSVTIAEED